MSAARHAYISKQNVTRRFRLLCRGVNNICGRQAKYTKKPFSQLKQTEFYGICGKRSASEYTQSEIMLANWQALLRSICGAQATNIRRSHFHNSSGRSFTVYAAGGTHPNIRRVKSCWQIGRRYCAVYVARKRQIYEEADLKIFKSASSFVPRTGLEPAHHL